MANSSNLPSIEPIHSFRDDSSTYSMESRDGVVTQDQSMDTSMTTDSVRRDRVKEWLNSTEDQQDKMQRAAIGPVLQYISNDPKVAQLVYESSSFKKMLKDFIKEGQEHAQAIREQVPKDVIQSENTMSISFSDATRPRLESDMKVKFKDATPLFTNNALQGFPPDSEQKLKSFNEYWQRHGGHERFLEWLDLTMLYTPRSVEAGSRCTIDMIFLGLAQMLKLWRYDVVHVPELKVRSGPLVPVFTVAGDPTTKVILNGSVDYAIVTRFLGSETGSPTGNTQDLLDRLTISQDAVTLFTNDTVQRKRYKLRILFVEAKKPPPTRQYVQDPIKWLRKHEGQAVAEAMAGLRCQQLVDKTLKEDDFLGLPWALTDGVNWLFGIVVHKYNRTGPTGSLGHLNSQWTSYELATAENDRRQTNVYPGLIRLMRILLFFSVHTPEDVFKMMMNRT